MRLSHAEAQALVSARLDGPLDPVAERELNNHLATCESCRAFNLSAVQLARGLQGMPRLASSPAVTRAVLAEVTAPRSGMSRVLTLLPENTLPVATAVAAAIVVLFIGAFGVLRVLDDDEPNVIPALVDPTSDSNVAQQRLATEEPTDEKTDQLVAATDEVVTSGTEAAFEATEFPAAPPTESFQSTEPANEGASESTESVDSSQATEEPEGASASGLGATESATEQGTDGSNSLRIGEEESPESTEQVEETVAPSAEPTDEPTSEPEPTEISVEETAGPTESGDEILEIGPSGQSTARADTPDPTSEPTVEPTATTEPTSTPEPTLEPTVTLEPTATPEPTATSEPTLEPTTEPTATLEPTATTEPTPEPTSTPEPTATTEPTPEPTLAPTPTTVPITQREETPIAGGDDVSPEADDGTGAATTEEPEIDGQSIVPADDEPEPGDENTGGQSPDNEDGNGSPPIEPADEDSIIGPPGSDDENAESDEPSGGDAAGSSEEQPAAGNQATAEPEQAQTDVGDEGSSTAAGSADVTLSNAPVVTDLTSIPGNQGANGARLGLDADAQLIYDTNPGRVSLARNGITLQRIDAESGQAVGACTSDEECVDISTASKDDAGGTDTPIGWIGDAAIYERLLSDDSVEFRAVTVDPESLQPTDDRSIDEGPWDWFTVVRPYPYNGGLLVPTLNYWLYITTDGVTTLSDNPVQQDAVQFRFKPDAGLIGYVSGGSIFVAPLDAPGDAIAQIPFDGYDYDISPDGAQVAILSGDGISIYDLSGSLVTTIPNPEGISVGSRAWVNEGIVFSDFNSGVLRSVQP